MVRFLLGISCLGLGILYLGLKLCILSLGDHILDCESILGVFGLQRWLSLLTLPSPFGDFNIRRKGLGGEELLRRKECSWNFSDGLWENDILNAPQFRTGKNPSPIKRFCLRLSVVVPAYPNYLFGQPRLRVQHPMFIGCCLLGLSSFTSHLSCLLNFLQLSLEIQNQLSLNG